MCRFKTCLFPYLQRLLRLKLIQGLAAGTKGIFQSGFLFFSQLFVVLLNDGFTACVFHDANLYLGISPVLVEYSGISATGLKKTGNPILSFSVVRCFSFSPKHPDFGAVERNKADCCAGNHTGVIFGHICTRGLNKTEENFDLRPALRKNLNSVPPSARPALGGGFLSQDQQIFGRVNNLPRVFGLCRVRAFVTHGLSLLLSPPNTPR